MNAQWRRRRRDIAGRPHRQSDETSLGTVILTLVAGALLTVTTGLAAMFELEQFGPAVGGIIVFKPDTAATERWSVKAAIVEAPHIGLSGETAGRHCVLSPKCHGRSWRQPRGRGAAPEPAAGVPRALGRRTHRRWRRGIVAPPPISC